MLHALADALQLDETERAHLFDLARAADSTGIRSRRLGSERVRPGLLQLLNAMEGPAYIRNSRFDLLAFNPLCRALYAPLIDSPAWPANTAWFTFLDAGSHEFWDDWNAMADGVVVSLRVEAGRNPTDKRLSVLVGGLDTRSTDFRQRWASHDVYRHSTGRKTLHHPVIGRITLEFEALTFPADDGLVLLAYTAQPGSSAAESLDLLGAWHAQPTRT